MPGDGSDRTLPLGDAALIEALRQEFERAADAGVAPRIEDYLERLGEALRPAAFRELLRDEAAQRRRRNEPVTAEAYLPRFPEYSDAIAEALAQNGQSETIGHAAPEHRSGLHVRCPHCHNPIELVPDAELESIECGTCGSQFSLTTDEDEKTRDARSVAQVGHFKLIERLGMGAFGAVWKALDTELDRTVAIKIPRSGQLDKQRQDFFFREARSAAQLRHPNIVPVYEVGREGDTLYIVSEFVRGVTLSDRLSAGALGSRETAELCASIADALHHAHEQGVIHRDLKPANVMIDAMGAPHLMDFGLARREAGEITMTLDGQVLGTPAYMSPEQAQGEAHVADRRSDIYSLGAMLFELVTGELPFRGNARMLIHQVIHDEPPSPRKLNAAVPKDLETITLKCLEKDPKRRFATAQELGDELRRYLAGEPIHSRPITRAEQAWRWCLRKPLIAGLSAAVAGLVVFAAVASQIAAVKQAALRADAEESADTAREMQEIAEAVAEKARQGELRQKELAAAEAEAREKAEKLIEANRQQLVRMNVLQGDALVERNDPARALPWYVEAMRYDEGDAEREAPHRLRLGMLWRNIPRFTHFLPHEAAVVHLAASRDGRLLAATSQDRTVRVWDLQTGQPATPPLVHKFDVLTSEFSADGKQLVTAGGALAVNGQICVWDVAAGKLVGQPILNPTATYFYAGLTDSGDILAMETLATNQGVGHARLFSGKDHKLLASHPCRAQAPGAEYVSQWADAPRGRMLTWEGETARVIDLMENARTVCELPRTNYLRSLRFSDDGSRVVTVESNELFVWDANTGKKLASYIGVPDGWNHEYYDYQLSARFSLDNSRVTVADGGQVMQLVVGDGQIEHFKNVPDVRRARPIVSRDGRWVAYASRDGGVRIWDVRGEKVVASPLNHPGAVADVLFAAGGRQVVTAGSDGGVRTWDLATVGGLDWRIAHEGLGAVLASADQKEIVTFGAPTVRRWDGNTQQQIGEFTEPGSNAIVWAAEVDISMIAVGRSDGTAQVFDYVAGKPASPILKHDRPFVKHVGLSFDGKHLATIDVKSRDMPDNFFGQANIWEIESGRRIFGPYTFAGPYSFPGVISAVTCLQFSPDNRFVAIGGGTVSLVGGKPHLKIIDLRTAKELDVELNHTRGLGVFAAAFDREGRRVISATQNPFYPGAGEVCIWDLDEGRMIGEPKLFSDDVNRIDVAGDIDVGPASRLASIIVGSQVHVLDLQTGEAAMRPLVHDDPVTIVAFSPDGQYLATIAGDNAVRLWDLSTGQRMGPPLRHPDRVFNGDFTRDGSLLTACADGLVRCWNFGPLDRPRDDLEHMSRLLSAEELAASRVMTSSARDLPAAWQDLSSRYPDDFRLTKDQEWLWHKEQSNWCWKYGEWLAAIPHFERMEEINDVNYVSFGTALCEAGQFERGAEKFDKAISQSPDEFWNYYTAAAALLRAGNIDAYHETCGLMLQRFGKTDDPRWAADVAKICLLGPNDFEPGSLPFELAQLALAKHEGHAMSRWIRLSGALAAYRESELARARSLAEELLGEPNEPERIECARFLLAMILWQQGDEDAARSSLGEGLDHREKNPITGAGSWLGRAFSELFQREAEKLMADRPASDGDESVSAK